MKLALLGLPAKHSLSPAMHRAALDAVGIPGDYVAREVDLGGFRAGVDEVRDGHLDGANITMPYKRVALEAVDVVGDSAQWVGAVNTLVRTENSVLGENTDVAGVVFSFAEASLPTSDPVIVLGAGGAAAAALVAMRERRQYVVARDPEKARLTANRVGTEATVISWGDPVPAGVVVNATSLGMRGEHLPEDLLAGATGFLDMPYGDAPTPTVARLRKRGVPVADGLDMLVGQAVSSFAIWAGRTVSATVLRAAAEQELLKRRRHASRTR